MILALIPHLVIPGYRVIAEITTYKVGTSLQAALTTWLIPV
jgi:hypothetical protein